MIAMLYLGAYTLYALMYFPIMLVLRKGFQTERGKKLFARTFAVVWFLIPTADYIVGRIYFEYLCHSDQMGLQVYKTVDGVRGIEVKGGSGIAKELLETYDLDYVETTNIREKVYALFRYTLDESGKLQWEEVEVAGSRYLRGRQQLRLPLNVVRYKWMVEDKQSGELLAENYEYSYHCGWAGPDRCVYQCQRKNSFYDVFYEQVLGLAKRNGDQ